MSSRGIVRCKEIPAIKVLGLRRTPVSARTGTCNPAEQSTRASRTEAGGQRYLQHGAERHAVGAPQP